MSHAACGHYDFTVRVAATPVPRQVKGLPEPIEIVLTVRNETASCAYWDEDAQRWSRAFGLVWRCKG